MFSTHPTTNFNFSVIFILSSANAVNLDQSMSLSFGKDQVPLLGVLSPIILCRYFFLLDNAKYNTCQHIFSYFLTVPVRHIRHAKRKFNITGKKASSIFL